MLRVFVDSGASIKKDELDEYNIDIIPLKILLGDKEYLDGVNLDNEQFYGFLTSNEVFPKTSLPSLETVETEVNKALDQGDQVIFLTLSSGISGTYNAIRMMYQDNPNVRVVDSKCAVGGMRILVSEINKMRDQPLDDIVARLNEIIPNIKVMAIPETLAYLYKGGRLSKTKYLLGSILLVKPIIGIDQSFVHVFAKKHGMKAAMKYLTDVIENYADRNFEIIPTYTYNKKNVDALVDMASDECKKLMVHYDDISHAIASHWGPNAFGYIFVCTEPEKVR